MKRLRTDGIVIHRAEVFVENDYHIAIDISGNVRELMPIADKAQHAIAFNGNTIAIAVVGCFAAAEKAKYAVPTDAQLSACVALLQRLNAQYGGKLWVAGHSQLGKLATNIPEKLVYGHTCPGERFPLAGVIQKSGLRAWTPPAVA